MGKGRGKGGCGILEGIGDCIQCIAGTICCLCVSGPILMIIGIVFFVAAIQNEREDRIDEFNMARDTWADGSVDNFNSFTDMDWSYSAVNSCGATANGTLVQSDETETARDPQALGAESDDQGTFAGYTHVVYQDLSQPQVGTLDPAGAATCTLTYTVLLQGNEVGTVETAQQQTVSSSFSELGCSRTSSSSRRSSTRVSTTNTDAQDFNTCANRCDGEVSGTTTTNFQCTTTEAPATLCVRVAPAAASTFEVATGQLPDMPNGATGSGCFLGNDIAASLASGATTTSASQWDPVETATFSAAGPLALDFLVRSERDPYLYFLDISDGTRDFGLTRGENLTVGFVAFFAGLILTAIICTCCYCIVKFARGNAAGRKQERPANPVGGALYDVSAKYGNYIPGGATAVGHPVQQQHAQGVPVSGKPDGYGTGPDGYNAGGAGYNETHPDGYPGGGTGPANPYGGGAGAASPYGGGAYGGGAAAATPPPPAGYPAV